MSKFEEDRPANAGADATETFVKTESDDRAGGTSGKSVVKTRVGHKEEPCYGKLLQSNWVAKGFMVHRLGIIQMLFMSNKIARKDIGTLTPEIFKCQKPPF